MTRSDLLIYLSTRIERLSYGLVSHTCTHYGSIFLYNVQVPAHEPKFDLLVNDEWSKRHMVTQKFIQAGRKVTVVVETIKTSEAG